MAILKNFDFYYTPPPPVAVVTNNVTNRSYTTARLHGNLTELGTEEEVDVWFQYWEYESGSEVPTGYSETSKQLKTETGTFFVDIESLTQGITYEFRAIAQGRSTGATEKYGSILTFTAKTLLSVELTDTITLSDKCKLRISIHLVDSLALSDETPSQKINFNLYDTITLSDIIELNVSLEKVLLEDTITLSDECYISLEGEVDLEDIITLSDEIKQKISFSLEDTLSLSDEIYVNIPQLSVKLSDTITLSDSIEIRDIFAKRFVDTLILTDEIEIKLNDVWQVDELEDTITLTDEIEILVTQRSNINNDFRSCIEVLGNVDNKFNTVIESINNLSNIFSWAFGKIYDIGTKNDFRTYAIATPSFDNDFRMLLPVQEPPTSQIGFQSLGKTYVKVYIDTIEQTDVDLDSIKITKSLNAPHTASFTLGRPYDDTKPDIEAEVEIKYHIWTLYKGYITNIIPGDTPDSIKINCQDEYWKQNRGQKYFHVGHKPSDDEDKYYNTLAEGLSDCGAEFGVGSFVPQTMNCFGIGASDCITNLVNNAGNYSWFYDEAGNKVLHTNGSGSLVKLERQEIGKQLGLYQVLSYNFNDDVSAIINKLRVTMGNKVIRSLDRAGEAGGSTSKTYSGYNYSYYEGHGVCDWENKYEVLAKNSANGYGYDYHKPEDDKHYKDVFRRYKLPYLDKSLASWSDRRKPSVAISGSGELSVALDLINEGYWTAEYGLKDGFTIDYEEGTITFNEPIFCYSLNEYGEVIDIWRPAILLRLWKKNYYSYTTKTPENPDPNPEDPDDITSPLIFITDKMGTYPETVFNSLELGGLSIQVGGFMEGDEEGEYILIPSWDDTAFAKDYADWQLSKTCDKKITGTIGLTLDAVCQYGIDLGKRINIEGVTEQPMNIESITYNINNFIINIELASKRVYSRSASLPSHGE